MDIFSGKIRLGGSLLNEVSRINMTAPEVILLRAMHGADAVVELKRTDSKNVKHDEERARLGDMYGEARDHDGESYLQELFGPAHRELPTHVPGYKDPDALPTVENMATEDDAAALMA